MPHKLRKKYLNSDFEANSKNKYEARIEKREHKEICFSVIRFLVVHWVLPCQMDNKFPEIERVVGKKGEIELNLDALRSIDHPHLYRQHFDFDETLPTSPFPQWKGTTITRRFRRSLLPYRGLYMYNSDRHEVLFPGKHGRAQIWRFTPLYRDCRLILRIQYL